MEGVVILHETIHELHTKKRDGVIFKIDFEKAYDKVNWSFLQQTLRTKGFAPKWCRWILSMVTCGSVGIKIMMKLGLISKPKEDSNRVILCHQTYLTSLPIC
jgi:hypothetical protein